MAKETASHANLDVHLATTENHAIIVKMTFTSILMINDACLAQMDVVFAILSNSATIAMKGFSEYLQIMIPKHSTAILALLIVSTVLIKILVMFVRRATPRMTLENVIAVEKDAPNAKMESASPVSKDFITKAPTAFNAATVASGAYLIPNAKIVKMDSIWTETLDSAMNAIVTVKSAMLTCASSVKKAFSWMMKVAANGAHMDVKNVKMKKLVISALKVII
jgi:hypothetical protein